MKEYKRTNVYETADEKTMKAIFDYAEGYKKFLGECKTEREACAYIVEEAEKKGYKQFDFSEKVKKGDKLYYNNRGKAVFIIKIGTGDIKKDGIRIVGSHIDNPRLDLKQVPLYEDNGVVYQTGELGKVDAGGGGTIAKFVANMNIDTIDIGVPVISMHSPYEVISKADLYMNYLAFKAFIK